MNNGRTHSVKVQLKHIILLDEFVRSGYYSSRAEVIRYALDEFLREIYKLDAEKVINLEDINHLYVSTSHDFIKNKL